MSGNDENPVYLERIMNLERDVAYYKEEADRYVEMVDSLNAKVEELENKIYELEQDNEELNDALRDVAYTVRKWR